MNLPQTLSLSVLSVGVALSAASLRADDTTVPPPPSPPAPETSPADGAQGSGHHHRRPGYVLSELTEKLNLTADQQAKVGAILKSDREQMKDMRGDESLSQDDKRAKMKELRAATKAQIRALLTPDQQAIFDALPAHG